MAETKDSANPREAGGWESLAEESEASLAPNQELEAALREAAEAINEKGELVLDQPIEHDSPADEVDSLRKEVIQTNDNLLRLHADFENFRRRSARERQELVQYGHENLVKDLLSTVDNLERAIDHADRSDGADLQGLLQGVEILQRELLGTLEKHHVTEIDAMGQAFDPAIHEAMSQTPDDSVPPNTVVEVLQTGYQLRGHLLRPARVIVTRVPKGDEKGES